MPRFEPFYGIRYAPSIPIGEVISPPYDIVDDAERSILAARNSANAIHVELPAERTGFADRYESAADIWTSWLRNGTVLYDHDPSLYVYRMTPPNGVSTIGVVGALSLEPPGDGILPHEETIPKDKTDRLELLRHCRANISPIWGLSLASGLGSLYAPVTSATPAVRAVDDESVLHELWVISDVKVTDSICRAVARAPVVVADGHHRYETALAFSEESAMSLAPATGRGTESGLASSAVNGLAEGNGVPGYRTSIPPSDGRWRDAAPGTGAGMVMALMVELSQDQLSVLPIHRMVSLAAPDSVSSVGLQEAFAWQFELKDIGPLSITRAMEVIRGGRMAMVSQDGMWELARRRQGSEVDSFLVGMAIQAVPKSVGCGEGIDISYTPDVARAVDAVQRKEARFAVLMRPVTVGQIADYARRKTRMPAKSTYFWPKPRTGMVFRSLDSPSGN
ncbi:MAG: DUF1015 domain-containing protein [Actinobacteria bacterium]|nr:DUF1015 domain-containing protein [Actinomycetota bacterium]